VRAHEGRQRVVPERGPEAAADDSLSRTMLWPSTDPVPR